MTGSTSGAPRQHTGGGSHLDGVEHVVEQCS
jgi:hypothetical protein